MDRSEIDQMKQFLIAANGGSAPTPAQSQILPPGDDPYDALPAGMEMITERAPDLAELNGHVSAYGGAPVYSAPPSTGSVSEMKDILTRFHHAAGNLIAEAPMDRPFREALLTEETPTGARMGSWEIVVNPVGKKRKLYDVVHTVTHTKIASELLIYEAALGLMRHLNNGGKINSSEVLELLRAEQEYATAIHDMRLYKHHLTKTPNSARTAIYEDRYGQSKRKAISARERVEKLSESF